MNFRYFFIFFIFSSATTFGNERYDGIYGDLANLDDPYLSMSCYGKAKAQETLSRGYFLRDRSIEAIKEMPVDGETGLLYQQELIDILEKRVFDNPIALKVALFSGCMARAGRTVAGEAVEICSVYDDVIDNTFRGKQFGEPKFYYVNLALEHVPGLDHQYLEGTATHIYTNNPAKNSFMFEQFYRCINAPAATPGN